LADGGQPWPKQFILILKYLIMKGCASQQEGFAPPGYPLGTISEFSPACPWPIAVLIKCPCGQGRGDGKPRRIRHRA
jgi:hypothetical protein